jgi:hypothetical protein
MIKETRIRHKFVSGKMVVARSQVKIQPKAEAEVIGLRGRSPSGWLSSSESFAF